jgi:hypothetical protein
MYIGATSEIPFSNLCANTQKMYNQITNQLTKDDVT